MAAAAAALRVTGHADAMELAGRLAQAAAKVPGLAAGRPPALRHLAGALAAPAAHPALAALGPSAPDLPWTEDGLGVPAGLAGRFCYATLIGPDAPIRDHSFYFGLFLQVPATLYPDHAHTPEELYYVLSGTAGWSQSGRPFAPRPPGTLIHHAPEEAHAMETGGEPLLAMWTWYGRLSPSNYRFLGLGSPGEAGSVPEGASAGAGRGIRQARAGRPGRAGDRGAGMIRTVSEADLDGLLAVNNASAVETSLLARSRLAAMVGMAYRALTDGQQQCLLLAFADGAPYDGSHFRWFGARYPRFVYVDRIVVAESARGRGLARHLYRELFAAASADGYDLVAAEVNLVPPNPVSDAFHEAMGFVEVGRSGDSDRPAGLVRRKSSSQACLAGSGLLSIMIAEWRCAWPRFSSAMSPTMWSRPTR